MLEYCLQTVERYRMDTPVGRWWVYHSETEAPRREKRLYFERACGVNIL